MEAEHASQLPLLPYVAILNRYAKMIIRDEAAAGELVKKVLEEERFIDPLTTQESLRRLLKSDLRALCFSWQLEKDAANFKGRSITEDDL